MSGRRSRGDGRERKKTVGALFLPPSIRNGFASVPELRGWRPRHPGLAHGSQI
ncbi:MAG: hypothetical protein MI923_12540 [Phycisphaerales bacterium]|nr:hypothetical protein [Phycisphaerales bacterium]